MAGNEINKNYPINYHGSAIPHYVSTTQISLSTIAEKSQDGLTNITSSTATTLSTATTGAGGILVSANLTGTVAVTSGSATVTGTGTSFSSNFIVGDVICIYGTSNYYGTITAIGSNTSLTCAANFTATASGKSFSRGGLSPNTFYYLYAISSATGGSATAALSTRSCATGDTFVDLPSGYTEYRQLAFALLTDSSGLILPFKVAEGWPHRPVICYNKGTNPADATTLMFSGSPTTSFTTISSSAFVPAKIANVVLINAIAGTTTAYYYLRHGATTTNSGQLALYLSNTLILQTRVGLDGSGNFQHMYATSQAMSIVVQGYIVTGVP